jgi:hypothetical protein
MEGYLWEFGIEIGGVNEVAISLRGSLSLDRVQWSLGETLNVYTPGGSNASFVWAKAN